MRHLVKVNEAAQALGVSKTFLYKSVERGKLPGVYRFGKAIRFDVDELRAWAHEQARQSQQHE